MFGCDDEFGISPLSCDKAGKAIPSLKSLISYQKFVTQSKLSSELISDSPIEYKVATS